MNDRITWVFYEIKDGYRYHHTPDEFNLVTYYSSAETQYNNAVAAGNTNYINVFGKVITLLKEMFNYGANAQVYFEYNLEAEEGNAYAGLVNLHIPEADRKLGKEAYADI